MFLGGYTGQRGTTMAATTHSPPPALGAVVAPPEGGHGSLQGQSQPQLEARGMLL